MNKKLCLGGWALVSGFFSGAACTATRCGEGEVPGECSQPEQSGTPGGKGAEVTDSEAGASPQPGGGALNGAAPTPVALGGSTSAGGMASGSSSDDSAAGTNTAPPQGGTGAGGATGGQGSVSAGGTAAPGMAGAPALEGGAGGLGDDPRVPATGVALVGRELYVDGQLFHIRGVNWNPVPKGAVHPQGLDFAGFADQDIALMKAAGINAVRTYERLEDRDVLDKLHAAGIYVFSTVYGWWQDPPSVVTERVHAVKDHPAIISWVIGNEWNYNHLYGEANLTLEQTRDQLNQAAALIKAADSEHPVSTIYGELGGIAEMVAAMPDVDLWGINAYRGLDHAALFADWARISDKPMYLGEYGADAWDSRGAGQLNTEAQAEATHALTQQIIDAYTGSGSGIASGGFVFEWADEWWKVGSGSPDVQDSGGFDGQGGGPHPDQFFNEEYWGLVDIDRTPRPAYEALKDLYAQ